MVIRVGKEFFIFNTAYKIALLCIVAIFNCATGIALEDAGPTAKHTPAYRQAGLLTLRLCTPFSRGEI
jgi:hypothetical protein